MQTMQTYQVKLTLCRLAAIAISKHLWQSSGVLKDELKSSIDRSPCGDLEDVMPSAVKTVMNHFVIPEAAKEELMFAVGTMGWELRNDFWELKGEYVLLAPEDSLFAFEASTCVDYVCWTTDGCLDTPETMRSLYFAGMLRASVATFEELCTYCLEDCINDLWPRISMDGYNDWRNRRLYRGDDSELREILIAYWTARMRNDVGNAINFVLRELLDEFYNEAFSLDENMFINSFVRRQQWAGILDNITYCKFDRFIDRDVKYRRIFYRIWEMNLQNLKSSVDYTQGLRVLSGSKAIDVLEYIFKDKELIHRREEFLEGIAGLYISNESNDVHLTDVVKNILVSDEEREWFRLQIVAATNERDMDVEDE